MKYLCTSLCLFLISCSTPEKPPVPTFDEVDYVDALEDEKTPFVMVDISTAAWQINVNGWPVVCFAGGYCAEPSIAVQEHYLRKSCSYHKKAAILMGLNPGDIVITPYCEYRN